MLAAIESQQSQLSRKSREGEQLKRRLRNSEQLAAKAIHAESRRSAGDFVPVNCAAIPAELLESELFGHEKGAFTGADRHKHGLFQAANGGSLFLDEIGELSLELQAKLLRTLQEGTIRSVGSANEVATDVRIIAATHRDLRREVEESRFREDLFYRLDALSIQQSPFVHSEPLWWHPCSHPFQRSVRRNSSRVKGRIQCSKNYKHCKPTCKA